jgi:hypothetical protein
MKFVTQAPRSSGSPSCLPPSGDVDQGADAAFPLLFIGTTLTSTALTYADWAKRNDPSGKIATIINLLSQTNEILEDALVVEANGPTSHRTTVRTGLPSATWRLLNYGVAQAKSTTAQVTDSIGMLETYSTIDKALADLNGATRRVPALGGPRVPRRHEPAGRGHDVLRQHRREPRALHGLGAALQHGVHLDRADRGQRDRRRRHGLDQHLHLGRGLGPEHAPHIFPKGQINGLQQRDLGEQTIYDASNNPYQAYRTHFKWDIGMCLRDWRYAVRIANIDVNLLSGGSAANLINGLVRAVHRLPTAPVGVSSEQRTDAPDGGAMSMGRTVIYCNKVIRTYLDIQAMNKTNVLLRLEEWNGKAVTTFRGVPIRTCDQLLNTESRLT